MVTLYVVTILALCWFVLYQVRQMDLLTGELEHLREKYRRVCRDSSNAHDVGMENMELRRVIDTWLRAAREEAAKQKSVEGM